DCSGWVSLLLMQAMQEENRAADSAVFAADDIKAMQSWSDRMIHELEARTAFILSEREISTRSLPRCATIGLKIGEPAWANNHPRMRGITHIVQVVRRSEDDAPFISESFGSSISPGISLTPLAEWLHRIQSHLDANEIWAVDPFRLASRN
ncbi:hypothetical protein, partial [Pseudomonas sp.]|uniref:hypothetical protein n=1 Tax=Pseudomonas sp. TaxID=306 RepID=UPI0026039993